MTKALTQLHEQEQTRLLAAKGKLRGEQAKKQPDAAKVAQLEDLVAECTERVRNAKEALVAAES